MAATALPLPVIQDALRVSVPYSSGQWLQQPVPAKIDASQVLFQSPIHRVNGCNREDCEDIAELIQVSVPYSSGQWLQRGHRRSDPDYTINVSVPYSSGQWLQPYQFFGIGLSF